MLLLPVNHPVARFAIIRTLSGHWCFREATAHAALLAERGEAPKSGCGRAEPDADGTWLRGPGEAASNSNPDDKGKQLWAGGDRIRPDEVGAKIYPARCTGTPSR